jgi:hypothetical protein
MPSAEYQREWKKRNPGKQAEYSKKWYDKHKAEYGPTRHRKNKTPEQLEKLRAQGNIQNRKHKEKRNTYCRQYRQDNLEQERVRFREWSQTPTGKACGVKNAANRRARQLAAEGSFTAEDIKNLYATQGGRCYYCSVEIKSGYHIEHMIPLSRGGRNDVSNICLACAPCNLSKHTKTAEEFQNADA